MQAAAAQASAGRLLQPTGRDDTGYLRQLRCPKAIKEWSLRSVQIKLGGKVLARPIRNRVTRCDDPHFGSTKVEFEFTSPSSVLSYESDDKIGRW